MKTTISNEALPSALSSLRAASPLVHNITNYVVMNNYANALLAIGVSPVVSHWVEVMKTGCDGMAVVSAISSARSPEAAGELIRLIEERS